MFLQRRAFYNLIHLPEAQGVDDLENWQKENYRSMKDAELYKRLQKNGLSIPNLETFSQWAEEYESPDEMTEVLAEDLQQKEQDALYLVLFELWRRYLPEKRCPSVFCDEFDHLISEYERWNEGVLDELEDIVSYFEQILDDHVDEGADPIDLLNTFQTYCAHNLEQFFYDYALQAVETANYDYAYDIIEGFYRYVNDPLWFDFLLARIATVDNPEKGTEVLSQIIKHVSSLDLAEEILVYLVQERNHPLFCQMANKTLPLLETEEDFVEFVDLCALHFESLELEEYASQLRAIEDKRRKSSEETALDPTDSDVKAVKKILNKKLQVER